MSTDRVSRTKMLAIKKGFMPGQRTLRFIVCLPPYSGREDGPVPDEIGVFILCPVRVIQSGESGQPELSG